MFTDKRRMTDFGDSYDAAELRFLDLICSLAKVSIQGYDKHRNVIYWNDSSEEMAMFC